MQESPSEPPNLHSKCTNDEQENMRLRITSRFLTLFLVLLLISLEFIQFVLYMSCICTSTEYVHVHINMYIVIHVYIHFLYTYIHRCTYFYAYMHTYTHTFICILVTSVTIRTDMTDMGGWATEWPLHRLVRHSGLTCSRVRSLPRAIRIPALTPNEYETQGDAGWCSLHWG